MNYIEFDDIITKNALPKVKRTVKRTVKNSVKRTVKNPLNLDDKDEQRRRKNAYFKIIETNKRKALKKIQILRLSKVESIESIEEEKQFFFRINNEIEKERDQEHEEARAQLKEEIENRKICLCCGLKDCDYFDQWKRLDQIIKHNRTIKHLKQSKF